MKKGKMAGSIEFMGETRNVDKIIIGKHQGRILLGRPRCRWED
jgi:hypothetical protein